MNLNSPILIQKLVSSPYNQLSNFAKQKQLNLSSATVIRDHWIRRITGLCIRCGRQTEHDTKCKECGTIALSSLVLLESLEPTKVLIRTKCRKCKAPLTYLVKDVLKKVKEYGSFRPSALCGPCRKPNSSKKEPKVVKPITPLKEKTPKVHKEPVKKTQKESTARVTPIVAKRPTPPVRVKTEAVVVTKPQMLTYRPFEALAALKIEKAG